MQLFDLEYQFSRHDVIPPVVSNHYATLQYVLLGKYAVKFGSYILQYPIPCYLLDIHSLASQFSHRMDLHTDNLHFYERQHSPMKAENWIRKILLNTFTYQHSESDSRTVYCQVKPGFSQTSKDVRGFKTGTVITWATFHFWNEDKNRYFLKKMYTCPLLKHLNQLQCLNIESREACMWV